MQGPLPSRSSLTLGSTGYLYRRRPSARICCLLLAKFSSSNAPSLHSQLPRRTRPHQQRISNLATAQRAPLLPEQKAVASAGFDEPAQQLNPSLRTAQASLFCQSNKPNHSSSATKFTTRRNSQAISVGVGSSLSLKTQLRCRRVSSSEARSRQQVVAALTRLRERKVMRSRLRIQRCRATQARSSIAKTFLVVATSSTIIST